jgi:hypothetical protein
MAPIRVIDPAVVCRYVAGIIDSIAGGLEKGVGSNSGFAPSPGGPDFSRLQFSAGARVAVVVTALIDASGAEFMDCLAAAPETIGAST